MKKIKDLMTKSGAGDWGTDELTNTLRKGTPGQGITDIGVKNKMRKESIVLDELSTDTMKSYAKKATDDVARGNKAGKRADGVVRARRLQHKRELDRLYRKEDLSEEPSDALKNRRKFGPDYMPKGSESSAERPSKISLDIMKQVYMGLKKNNSRPDEQRRLKAKLKSYGVNVESFELEEGTLAAKDNAVVSTLLDAVKEKLLKDLEQGKVDDANEIAKLVKMTIEKDFKHKGYSRLKRK